MYFHLESEHLRVVTVTEVWMCFFVGDHHGVVTVSEENHLGEKA